MRSENIDFVTIKTSLNALKKKHERSDEDSAILAKARVENIMRGQEFFVTERELSRFHFTLKENTYIFQTSGTKIIAERVASGELAIKAFEKGSPRAVSRSTTLAIENYLRSKSLITDITLIAAPLSSNCITSDQSENEIIVSEKNWELLLETDLEGDVVTLSDNFNLPVVFPPFFAMTPDLSSHASLNEDPTEDNPTIFTNESDENNGNEDVLTQLMTETFGAVSLQSEMIYVEESILDGFTPQASLFSLSEKEIIIKLANATDIEKNQENFENERSIGLKIHDLIGRMGAGHSVDDVQKCINELNAIESSTPGILQGLPIPSFEKACLICFERILGGKNCFIDDLDEALLNLGLAAGLSENDAKKRMSDQALKLFMTNLSLLAGKPLKKSRAEKIRAFGALVGRKIIGSSQLFSQAKKLIEDIYEHEAMRTLKHNRDQELIGVYSNLNDWFAKN